MSLINPASVLNTVTVAAQPQYTLGAGGNGTSVSMFAEKNNATVTFVVARADNGFIIATNDHNRFEDHRYIANNLDELKDLFVSILVQNKLDGA